MAEDAPRPEALEASCAPWPGDEPAAWPDGEAAFIGKPAAVKFASTPPPDGTAIQTRNATALVPAATALDRGPFDAPRHHRRKAGNGASARLMGDLAPRLADPLRPHELWGAGRVPSDGYCKRW